MLHQLPPQKFYDNQAAADLAEPAATGVVTSEARRQAAILPLTSANVIYNFCALSNVRPGIERGNLHRKVGHG